MSNLCEKLEGESCAILREKCFRSGRLPCALSDYYTDFTDISNDTPPIARKVREDMLDPFILNWKEYAAHGAPAGRKNMTATPLEKQLRAVLRSHLAPLGVSVPETGRRFYVWKDSPINADALAEKEGFPRSIFSFKAWVGTEQVRETFAYAYLAKTWLGQKLTRVYEIGVRKSQTQAGTLESLVGVCKPYLDGVFYLTAEPYLDDLIKDLKQVYSEHQL